MFKKDNKYNNIIISSTCLLLNIAHADEKIEKNELDSIKDIIKDFFDIDSGIDDLIDTSMVIMKNSTDLFEFSKSLNEKFSYQDKVDFICCAFEVAYSDKSLHYMEEFFIKKIANTLNVEHKDLINAKKEMKDYL